MTLNIMKLQKKTIWVLKISSKKPLFLFKRGENMNYYKLKKMQKDKQFFYDHSGYFNFWDEVLILRDKSYATKDSAGLV